MSKNAFVHPESVNIQDIGDGCRDCGETLPGSKPEFDQAIEYLFDRFLSDPLIQTQIRSDLDEVENGHGGDIIQEASLLYESFKISQDGCGTRPVQRHSGSKPDFDQAFEYLFDRFLSDPLIQAQIRSDLDEVQNGRGGDIIQEACREYESPTPLNQDFFSTQHDPDIVVVRPPIQLKGSPKVPLLPSTKIHITSLDIPRFYYPIEAFSPAFADSVVQHSVTKVEEYIKSCSDSVNFSQFGSMLVAVGVPLYWKKPFWKVFGLNATDTLSAKSFIPFYESLLRDCSDEAARFIRILYTAGKFSDDNIANITNNKGHSSAYENHGKLPWDLRTAEACMSDFTTMIQDIIDTHPSLGCLRDAPDFHSRYITTVISRIFYKINRSWTGRMTLCELRRSNLLRAIKQLQEVTDVNKLKEYFSYQHFYVIYCKFWELDRDHDLLIDKNDLAIHNHCSLSSRIIDRIFSGTVLRGWDAFSPVKCGPGKMTYSDFVWFLLSEEDKKTPTAIEYWFRCLDMDGDGILSPYEAEYFYTEQANSIEAMNTDSEPMDFKNVHCQIADMLQCSTTVIRLRDLKKNPSLAATIFNTLFNVEKYFDQEQRFHFATAASASGSHDSIEGDTDWDKYAAAEYEFLIAGENSSGEEENPIDTGSEEEGNPIAGEISSEEEGNPTDTGEISSEEEENSTDTEE